jgi:hypothetical protein
MAKRMELLARSGAAPIAGLAVEDAMKKLLREIGKQ